MPTRRRHSPFFGPRRGTSPSGSDLLSLGLGTLVCAAALTTTSEARALPLLQLSGSARWLYAESLSKDDDELSSAGFGLSAGVTLPQSFYLGASFQYFVGTNHTYTYVNVAGDVVSREKFSNSTSQLLAHVGYDIGLLALTFRPSVGLGWWRSAYRGTCAAFCEPNFNRDGFSLSPGLEVIYSFGLFNVSAEARFDAVAYSHGGSLQNTLVGLGAGLSL